MKRAERFYRYMIYGNPLTVIIRAALGLLFIYSGFFQALNPELFGELIARYQMIPRFLVPYFALVLPYCEILAGLALAAGFAVRGAALTALLLMVVFITAISVNLIRGETFDCGCFHLERLGITVDETLSVKVLARDLVISLLLLYIFLAQRHLFSLEYVLEKRKLKNL